MAAASKGEMSQGYRWTFPICPHDVCVELSVLRALRDELAAGSSPRQGLLLGRREARLTRIDAAEPLPELNAEVFAAAIARTRRQAVGYYTIRDGCAFILNSDEIALARSMFREPGSLVMLVERRSGGGAEATFAFWRGAAFVSNLPHPFPLDPDSHPAAPQPEPALPPPAESRLDVLRRHARPIGLASAAGLGLAMLPLIWLHSGRLPGRGTRSPAAPPARTAAPPQPARPAVSLVSRAPGDIQIAWDPAALSTATTGLLKIVDGEFYHHVSLDAGQLRYGSVFYRPGPGPVTAELKVMLQDGRLIEVPVTEGAAPGAAPLTPAPARVAEAKPAPARVAEVKPVPARVAEVKPVPARVAEAKPAPPARVAEAKPAPVRVAEAKAAPPAPLGAGPRGLPLPSPPPVAERRQVAKRFDVSSAAARGTAKAPALPDAPAVHPVAAAAPLLTSSVPATPPPAPERVRLGTPAAHPDHGLPAGSGRLIWTGTLERRGVVELEGRSVSVGSLTGSLPGIPIHVTVLPAEFGTDGVVVYTTDARMNGHVEPPSAANGWNRIHYTFDPERVRQIAVLEAPNASNRFSHLALRSDARRLSLLVIDWTAQTTTAATR